MLLLRSLLLSSSSSDINIIIINTNANGISSSSRLLLLFRLYSSTLFRLNAVVVVNEEAVAAQAPLD